MQQIKPASVGHSGTAWKSRVQEQHSLLIFNNAFFLSYLLFPVPLVDVHLKHRFIKLSQRTAGSVMSYVLCSQSEESRFKESYLVSEDKPNNNCDQAK